MAAQNIEEKIKKYLPISLMKEITDIKEYYDFEGEIGEGTQAVVYRVRNKATGEQEAVKKILMAHMDCRKRWDRLGREIKVLHELRGKASVMELRAVYYTQHDVYLVTEYLAGGELYHFILEQGHFPEEETRHMMRQLVAAVACCHERRIVHRDLKPENILLHSKCRYPTLKVGDFGYSKQLDSRDLLRHSAVGSPMYAAPEVFRELPYSLDVDMFSVGVIMFILLVGYPPFHAADDAAMIEAVGQFDARLAFDSLEWDDISEDAKDLIELCIAPPSRQRITANAFLAHPWMTARFLANTVAACEAEEARRCRFAASTTDSRSSFLTLPVVSYLRDYADEDADQDDEDDVDFPADVRHSF